MVVSTAGTPNPEGAGVRPPIRPRRPFSRTDSAALILGVALSVATLSLSVWRVAQHVVQDRAVVPGRRAEQQHTH